MTRLAWTLPGASPAVLPEKSPARMRKRSRVPAATPRTTDSVITSHPHVQFELFTTPRLGDAPLSVLYLAAAIVFEICGTTSLKLSQGFTQIGPAVAVVVCYAASFA